MPICQAAVVSPSHDAPCQFASGMPSEAIATQRPIVATDFPRARELLAAGIGLLVPPRFPRRRRTPSAGTRPNQGLADTLSARCADLARALGCHAVADSSRALAKALAGTGTRYRTAT